MSGQVIPYPALQRMCRPEGPAPRASTVRRWADRQGIRYKYDGRGGIWTTLDALNAALGLMAQPVTRERVEDLV